MLYKTVYIKTAFGPMSITHAETLCEDTRFKRWTRTAFKGITTLVWKDTNVVDVNHDYSPIIEGLLVSQLNTFYKTQFGFSLEPQLISEDKFMELICQQPDVLQMQITLLKQMLKSLQAQVVMENEDCTSSIQDIRTDSMHQKQINDTNVVWWEFNTWE